ncbi:MAG: hypothetical protein MI746_17460, partial [Pseudomonadales bacterium]|nr:hypothetical protein [Pseudomonadales bacterium]
NWTDPTMLFVANWLVIIVFWYFIIQLAHRDGLKLPAFFGTLWISGYFLFPQLGLEGGLYFISYAALLTLIVIYIDMTRERMGLRKPKTDPLTEESTASSEESQQ